MNGEITSLMLQQIQEIEQRDESQVLAELAGETISEYNETPWDCFARFKSAFMPVRGDE